MTNVCEVLSLMTVDNAEVFRAAFDESMAAGLLDADSKKLYLDRVGELLGQAAFDWYPDDPERKRIMVAWSRVAPSEAVDWVNSLPEGSDKLRATLNMMWGIGLTDGDYAQQVFDILEPEIQETRLADYMTVAYRRGGNEACASVAAELLSREGEHFRKLAERAYQFTQAQYAEISDESLSAWLDSLTQAEREILGIVVPTEVNAAPSKAQK